MVFCYTRIKSKLLILIYKMLYDLASVWISIHHALPSFFFRCTVLYLLWRHGAFLVLNPLYPLSPLPGPPFHDSSYSLDLRWNVTHWQVFSDHPYLDQISHFEFHFPLSKELFKSPNHNLWVSCLSMCYIAYFVSHQFLIACYWNPSACHISES